MLTQLSIFWFDFLRDVTPTHFLTANVDEYPEALQPFREQLEGRSMLVKRAQMVEIECVARGYLAGSGLERIQSTRHGLRHSLARRIARERAVCRNRFSRRRPRRPTGHDENISFETMCSMIGAELGARLRDLTLRIYSSAAAYAETKGVIIADTKFEFGFVDGELVLGDEVLTPDSSRFWPAESYRAGGAQFSYDKQYVRDYLESIHWDKQPPAPPLPDEVARKTSEKYRQAYEVLTGKQL